MHGICNRGITIPKTYPTTLAVIPLPDILDDPGFIDAFPDIFKIFMLLKLITL